MNSKESLQHKLALLESTNDHLIAEIGYVDNLMRLVGFTNGIASLKETALELHRQTENPLEELS